MAVPYCRCPLFPPVRAFTFIAHNVQHSHFSGFCARPLSSNVANSAHALMLSARQFLRTKKSLRAAGMCALGETGTRDLDVRRDKTQLTTPLGTPTWSGLRGKYQPYTCPSFFFSETADCCRCCGELKRRHKGWRQSIKNKLRPHNYAKRLPCITQPVDYYQVIKYGPTKANKKRKRASGGYDRTITLPENNKILPSTGTTGILVPGALL